MAFKQILFSIVFFKLSFIFCFLLILETKKSVFILFFFFLIFKKVLLVPWAQWSRCIRMSGLCPRGGVATAQWSDTSYILQNPGMNTFCPTEPSSQAIKFGQNILLWESL